MMNRFKQTKRPSKGTQNRRNRRSSQGVENRVGTQAFRPVCGTLALWRAAHLAGRNQRAYRLPSKVTLSYGAMLKVD